ncbi:MAG: hypothetical protein ACP5M0_03440 [Desulfomonilaceae bacterium]
MKTLYVPLIILGCLSVPSMYIPASLASDHGNASNGANGQTNTAHTQNQAPAEWGPLKHWETQVMGVRVKGNAQRRGNEIRGVLHIYPPMSHKWTYHWSGRIEGDTVVASHSDGHTFRGTITPEKVVVGVVTTKDGRKIPLRAPLP